MPGVVYDNDLYSANTESRSIISRQTAHWVCVWCHCGKSTQESDDHPVILLLSSQLARISCQKEFLFLREHFWPVNSFTFSEFTAAEAMQIYPSQVLGRTCSYSPPAPSFLSAQPHTAPGESVTLGHGVCVR